MKFAPLLSRLETNLIRLTTARFVIAPVALCCCQGLTPTQNFALPVNRRRRRSSILKIRVTKAAAIATTAIIGSIQATPIANDCRKAHDELKRF